MELWVSSLPYSKGNQFVCYYELMHFSIFVCFSPLQSLFILMLRLSHLWSVRASASWLLGPFCMISTIFKIFLAFQVHLIHFLFKTWNQPFHKELCLVPSSGKLYLEATIWALGVLITSRYFIVSRSFQHTEEGKKYFFFF